MLTSKMYFKIGCKIASAKAKYHAAKTLDDEDKAIHEIRRLRKILAQDTCGSAYRVGSGISNDPR